MSDEKQYSVGYQTKFEPWVVEHVCKPILDKIPTSVHPNTISIGNHVLCWLVFVALASAPHLDIWSAFFLRVIGGVGLIASMILDCLDGMQARRTGKTSKLGACLDHWFDAINVPLATAGTVLTLGLDPWTVAVATAASVLVYNSQVVLYNERGRFIHPPGVDGAMAQTTAGILMIAFAALLLFFPVELRWVAVFLTGLVWCINVVQFKIIWWYFHEMKQRRTHLGVTALSIGLVLLTGFELISPFAGALALVFLSYRSTGTWVLYTVLGRDTFNRWDWALVLWLGLILFSHWAVGDYTFRGYHIENTVPYLGMVYIALANLVDLGKQLPELTGNHRHRPA